MGILALIWHSKVVTVLKCQLGRVPDAWFQVERPDSHERFEGDPIQGH